MRAPAPTGPRPRFARAAPEVAYELHPRPLRGPSDGYILTVQKTISLPAYAAERPSYLRFSESRTTRGVVAA